MGGAAENKQWAWIECGMCPQEELASPKASPPQLNPQGLRASLHEARTTSLQPPDKTPVDVVAPVHSPGWAVGMGRPRAEELVSRRCLLVPRTWVSAPSLGHLTTSFGPGQSDPREPREKCCDWETEGEAAPCRRGGRKALWSTEPAAPRVPGTRQACSRRSNGWGGAGGSQKTPANHPSNRGTREEDWKGCRWPGCLHPSDAAVQ